MNSCIIKYIVLLFKYNTKIKHLRNKYVIVVIVLQRLMSS